MTDPIYQLFLKRHNFSAVYFEAFIDHVVQMIDFVPKNGNVAYGEKNTNYQHFSFSRNVFKPYFSYVC